MPFLAYQKGQEKDNSCSYIRQSFTQIWKVNCRDSGLQGLLISPFLVIKKGQEKDNFHFYIVDRVWNENILNINNTSIAFTFITFTTQKLNKNQIRLFHGFLVYLLQTLPEEVDSWPFQFTFSTLTLDISAKGPAKGANDWLSG